MLGQWPGSGPTLANELQAIPVLVAANKTSVAKGIRLQVLVRQCAPSGECPIFVRLIPLSAAKKNPGGRCAYSLGLRQRLKVRSRIWRSSQNDQFSM